MWRSARVDDPGELSSSEEKTQGRGHSNTNDQRAVLGWHCLRILTQPELGLEARAELEIALMAGYSKSPINLN